MVWFFIWFLLPPYRLGTVTTGSQSVIHNFRNPEFSKHQELVCAAVNFLGSKTSLNRHHAVIGYLPPLR